jgi:hypothetical protein
MTDRRPPRESTDSFRDRKWKEQAHCNSAQFNYTNPSFNNDPELYLAGRLVLKDRGADTFGIQHYFDTTEPPSQTLTTPASIPTYFIKTPNGVDTEIGVGGNAPNVKLILGNGGESTDPEGYQGGDAGNFIIQFGNAGPGGDGFGNVSRFFIKKPDNTTIFEVNETNVAVNAILSVSGTLNLLDVPNITVTSTSNNSRALAFQTRSICTTNTAAGFGGIWRSLLQAGAATMTAGDVTFEIVSSGANVYFRNYLQLNRGGPGGGAVECYRFQDSTASALYAVGAFGGNCVANCKHIIYTNEGTNVGLAIRPTATQTANLQTWQDSAGATQLAIAANGRDFVLDTTTGSKIGTATTQRLGFWNAAPVVQNTGWTANNVTANRVFDASATTLAEVANVLGTLINQLKTYGLLGA